MVDPTGRRSSRPDTRAPVEAPTIWLLQDGEPLPTDPHPRLMRTGRLAEKLVAAGFCVAWWTSRFHHQLKAFRAVSGPVHAIGDRYRLYLLDGPPYRKNISWSRVRHYRRCAEHFDLLSASLQPPDLVLGSYPSPELCHAGQRFAARHGVPFIVDIRDPWPDIFPEYFSRPLRWGLFPVLAYYRRKFHALASGATGIVSVSEAMLEWGLHYAARPRSPRDRVFYIGCEPSSIARPLGGAAAGFSTEAPLTCLLVSSCGRSYDGATLIEAARLLEASGERRARFIITGDGEMRARWMGQAAGLDAVRFTGYITHEALQQHLSQAHLGLVLMHGGITRYWLGNKIFEYLASSLGLVNNVPGEAAELIREHGLGLSIPPGDPAALAAVVRQFLAAPEQVTAAMVHAHRAARELFDRDRLCDRYVDYLAGCLATRRGGSPAAALTG